MDNLLKYRIILIVFVFFSSVTLAGHFSEEKLKIIGIITIPKLYPNPADSASYEKKNMTKIDLHETPEISKTKTLSITDYDELESEYYGIDPEITNSCVYKRKNNDWFLVKCIKSNKFMWIGKSDAGQFFPIDHFLKKGEHRVLNGRKWNGKVYSAPKIAAEVPIKIPKRKKLVPHEC